jgi:hypothetical protein|tara:strand:+ start:1693 stop:2250 length:558 start_codon:yes stop_codon:yes gene_type:complete
MQRSDTENEVVFVDDEPFEKAEVIYKYLKSHERIFFIDFGISVDEGSLDKVFDKNDSIGCLVFPGVTEGIDWGMFKEKVLSKSNEPVEQIGLHFDTIVANKISDDIYSVNETSAKSWVMMNKNVMKHLKDKKNGAFKIHPRMKNMFLKLKEGGVKIHAYTAAKLIMTYSHECIGNILNAAGIKSN